MSGHDISEVGMLEINPNIRNGSMIDPTIRTKNNILINLVINPKLLLMGRNQYYMIRAFLICNLNLTLRILKRLAYMLSPIWLLLIYQNVCIIY